MSQTRGSCRSQELDGSDAHGVGPRLPGAGRRRGGSHLPERKTGPGTTDQCETTKDRFPDWYRTRVDGKTWDMSNHVGKGNSHDPRHTIRIAFAWDEANGRVIVGFVGMHQRNRLS